MFLMLAWLPGGWATHLKRHISNLEWLCLFIGMIPHNIKTLIFLDMKNYFTFSTCWALVL
ncbi:unknown [Methanothermobacter thermautotrophicus str. Delta H]|uniref:Uncharacterized protein n=1 Tax=Methanothermobacter thermautotrophicus (strain ATCC 29096 / DSM 1053 / JCM 10044 / NBRC 100330 / Delta H) TaxID=187420 RepID=O26192_METTH|nr:unknown [Methanothermobacter thermautotrophicus str. Delta H]